MTIEYPTGNGVHKFSQEELYELMCMSLDHQQAWTEVVPASKADAQKLGKIVLSNTREIIEDF